MLTLRVQHLAGFGLEVPDLEVARNFYTAFGLHLGASVDGAQCFQTEHASAPEVVLLLGAVKRLHHIAFGVLASDLPLFAEHLRQLGTPCTQPPFAGIRAGLWFQDPWGTWVNLVAAAAPTRAEPKAVQVRVDRHLWRELPRTACPRRLGHMLVYTPDWEKAQDFYAQALGLRVTDRAVDKVSFMAAGSGVRDHHCFGFINSTHRGYQHASFYVDSLDEIGLGALQMQQAGFGEGFGPGRHALASNLFHYVRDPWGTWVEYYTDMDQVSEAWQATDWHELPYIWPAWAPEFWANEMNANVEARAAKP